MPGVTPPAQTPLDWRRLAALALAAGVALACGPRIDSATGEPLGESPRARHEVKLHARKSLTESSGVVMSPDQPGVFFTFNDSGHDPVIFALDTAGSDRGAWRVANASNADWEAAAIGPSCSADGSPCLYIGDVGDNDAQRPSRRIYRMAEPKVHGAGADGALTAESLRYVYADGAHDVEAMYVGPTGTLYLITKRPLIDARGRARPALVFRLDASLWSAAADRDTLVVAALDDSIPIVPSVAFLRNITDASLSPDSRFVAVRTYGQVYIFAADTATGRIRSDVDAARCDISGLEERQGEGVTWADVGSGRLLLTSEGRREPARLVDCPLPAPVAR